ncbi:hypothetical protein JXB02_00185 [Candidatus Woesearchaeota archaeon]|nr:hypothetical protein [Candidatus Woesearchaeota archaeon]
MVEKRLFDYIKGAVERGYSLQDIQRLLGKAGISEKTIEDIYGRVMEPGESLVNAWVYTTLIFGLNLIFLIITLPTVIFLDLTVQSDVLIYLLLTLLALVESYFTYFVIRNVDSDGRREAHAGTFAPILPLLAVFGTFIVAGMRKVTTVTLAGAAGATTIILHEPTAGTSPLVAAGLFYAAFNSFILYELNRQRRMHASVWLLGGILIYLFLYYGATVMAPSFIQILGMF